MKLIVGLGNPGNEYAFTRHNIGFMVIDYISGFLGKKIKPGKGDWIGTDCVYNGEDIYILKPTTYMNNSGTAVADFISRYNIDIEDIFVIYDDFQIPLGTIRVRTSSSDGGHNGIASVIYHLNTLEFARMRIGIGNENVLNKEEYIDFVLSDFTEEESEKIKEMMVNYKDCVLSFIEEGVVKTMNRFNKNFLDKTEDNKEDNLIN